MAKNKITLYMDPDWLLDPTPEGYNHALNSVFSLLSGKDGVSHYLSSYNETEEFYFGDNKSINVVVNKSKNTLVAEGIGFPYNPVFMHAAKVVLVRNLKIENFQQEGIDISDKKAKYVVRLTFKGNIEESGTLSISEALDVLETLSCFDAGDDILQNSLLLTINSFKKDIRANHPRSAKPVSVGNVFIIKLDEKPKQVKEEIEEVAVSGTTAINIGDVVRDLESVIAEPMFDDAEVKAEKRPQVKRRSRTTTKKK